MIQLTTPPRDKDKPEITYWHNGVVCCDDIWERAYERFETPEEEVAKFLKRFRTLGVTGWSRDLEMVELFCGRGNGLVALARLGFTNIEGVDLSPDLLKKYKGPGQLYVGDCRDLRFASESKDVVVVQGGLHHLPVLPQDLDAVLSEIHRVLRAGGRFVVVEPWKTPFLQLVHAGCELNIARRLWSKLDALALMTEREIDTYEQWLGQPQMILNRLATHFTQEVCRTRWGKLMYVGRKD